MAETPCLNDPIEQKEEIDPLLPGEITGKIKHPDAPRDLHLRIIGTFYSYKAGTKEKTKFYMLHDSTYDVIRSISEPRANEWIPKIAEKYERARPLMNELPPWNTFNPIPRKC